MSVPNVLRVNTVEERTAYRNAVSQSLCRVMSDKKQTLLEMAERIDVSLGTISNAFNKKTDLCPTYLIRLANAYGPEFLDPCAALCGGRIVPLEADDELDALPALTATIHKIAMARSPNSPGRGRTTHVELLGMESEINAAIKALTAMKVKVQSYRSAA